MPTFDENFATCNDNFQHIRRELEDLLQRVINTERKNRSLEHAFDVVKATVNAWGSDINSLRERLNSILEIMDSVQEEEEPPFTYESAGGVTATQQDFYRLRDDDPVLPPHRDLRRSNNDPTAPDNNYGDAMTIALRRARNIGNT